MKRTTFRLAEIYFWHIFRFLSAVIVRKATPFVKKLVKVYQLPALLFKIFCNPLFFNPNLFKISILNFSPSSLEGNQFSKILFLSPKVRRTLFILFIVEMFKYLSYLYFFLPVHFSLLII